MAESNEKLKRKGIYSVANQKYELLLLFESTDCVYKDLEKDDSEQSETSICGSDSVNETKICVVRDGNVGMSWQI